jgi:hypothetical protein
MQTKVGGTDGDWRRLYREELQNLCAPPDIIIIRRRRQTPRRKNTGESNL